MAYVRPRPEQEDYLAGVTRMPREQRLQAARQATQRWQADLQAWEKERQMQSWVNELMGTAGGGAAGGRVGETYGAAKEMFETPGFESFEDMPMQERLAYSTALQNIGKAQAGRSEELMGRLGAMGVRGGAAGELMSGLETEMMGQRYGAMSQALAGALQRLQRRRELGFQGMTQLAGWQPDLGGTAALISAATRGGLA